MNKITNCLYCGETITGNYEAKKARKDKKYCSDTCRNYWYRWIKNKDAGRHLKTPLAIVALNKATQTTK